MIKINATVKGLIKIMIVGTNNSNICDFYQILIKIALSSEDSDEVILIFYLWR